MPTYGRSCFQMCSFFFDDVFSLRTSSPNACLAYDILLYPSHGFNLAEMPPPCRTSWPRPGCPLFQDAKRTSPRRRVQPSTETAVPGILIGQSVVGKRFFAVYTLALRDQRGSLVTTRKHRHRLETAQDRRNLVVAMKGTTQATINSSS